MQNEVPVIGYFQRIRKESVYMVEILTEKELAGRLKCSVPAIRVWKRQGMPVRKIGRLNRYELSRVLAWFDGRQDSRKGGDIAHE